MPTVCIQCAMRAMLKGEQSPVFNETPEEHQRLHHADLAATRVERAELEQKVAEKLKGEHDA